VLVVSGVLVVSSGVEDVVLRVVEL